MTPTQQMLFARYGTFDPAEIAKKKQAEKQSRDVITQKGAMVKMTVEECQKACKACGVEYLDGYENRVLQYVMSDESVDRAGDIMIMAGANLKEFKANGVILRMHDYREFPVGYGLKVWVEEKQLRGQILFLDDRVDTSGVADRAFRFAKSGVMKACSIGFGADSVKYPSQEEREELGMKMYGVIFEKWTLREVSVCPVPANKNALTEAVNKGLLKPEDAKFALGEDALSTEPPGITPAPVLDPVVKTDEVDPEAAADRALDTLMEKSGRVISAATKKKLQKVYDRIDDLHRSHRKGMKDCLEELKSLLYEELPDPDDEGEEEESDKSTKSESTKSAIGMSTQRLQLMKAKIDVAKN